MVAVTCVAALVAPHPSRACTCASGPAAAVRWPQDGATGVATDTPIVIWRYNFAASTDELGVSLTGSDGSQVALTEALRLLPAWVGCGKGEHVFLRPEHDLAAGATFTLEISALADPEGRWGATFTVGDERFGPQAPVDPQIDYLSVAAEPCAGAQCSDLAEIRVEFGQPPEQPLWLVVESSAPEHGVNDWAFWPAAWFEQSLADPKSRWLAQRSVALPPGNECVDIRIYGVEGRALLDERRCQPDRCAVYESRGYSDCGDPPTSGIDASRIPAESCDDPPVLISRPGVGIVYPEPDAVLPDAGAQSEEEDMRRDAGERAGMAGGGGAGGTAPGISSEPIARAGGGCSAQPARTASRPISALALVVVFGLLVAARRALVRARPRV